MVHLKNLVGLLFFKYMDRDQEGRMLFILLLLLLLLILLSSLSSSTFSICLSTLDSSEWRVYSNIWY